MGARQGGVVLRHRGDQGDVRTFVPVGAIDSLAPMPSIAPVVGAALPLLGVAAVAGALLPVVHLGAVSGEARRHSSHPPNPRPPRPPRSPRPPSLEPGPTRPLIVCIHEGEHLGLAGVEVIAIGHFDEAETRGAVLFEGETLAPLDFGALVALLRPKPWAGRVRP